ncbi:VPA1267 family protein [Marinobacter sp. LN3S78]|uniref:VPA1267 family protein n=1 Tax=Marinobacter sp. LN3S78 TaxID=3382300 RepID=UPI00387B113A
MSQERGQIYLERFQAWSASMSDDDFRQIVYGPMGILNRQEIKKLAGLSDQAIKKNANVKQALKDLEDSLRERAVLPPLTDSGKKAQAGAKLYDKTARRSSADSQRLAQLESTNHDLQVRIEKLEKENEALRSKLASTSETVEAIKDGLVVFTQCPMS